MVGLLLVRLLKQNLVISFIFVRVYSLATVEWNEFLPGSSLSPLEAGNNNPFQHYCLYCGNYVSINGTPALRSGRGWPALHPCFTNQTSSPWSHLGHLFAGIAMSSWRSTEQPEDFFSESVVSHLALWVSSCGVLVCFWLGLFCFNFGRHLTFLLSLFSHM